MPDKRIEGWGFPLNSRKAHYFVGADSLCKKWMYFGRLEADEFETHDDCKECRRRLERRKAKEAVDA